MDIQVDTREKKRAIKRIIGTFDKLGIHYYSSKLYVGDYMSLDNPRCIVDRKQNLSELCQNVCQGKKRFKEELRRANDAGIKMIILCEHGNGVCCMEDVKLWVNPRLEESPYAISGYRLYKMLSALEKQFGTKFMFCDKKDTGSKIIELLGGVEHVY